MVRTQIQLPDGLYREAKRIADAQQWSIAELIRRGTEIAVREYRHASHSDWKLPAPRKLGLRIPAESLRDLIADEESTRTTY